jgi:uncharacterized circularly permuted ATP-grasp superfamily protein
VDDYPAQLYDTLAAAVAAPGERPVIAVLTPGIFNSAYFEHSYLAQQMGAHLVEGSDLVVRRRLRLHEDHLRPAPGRRDLPPHRRRLPRPGSLPRRLALGVPGLMRAWRAGNVGIANAPGAGVADDKVVYAFVPKMIKYYLGEEPILPNVPSYLCMYEDQRVRAGQPRQAGGQAGQRVGRLRHADRAARDAGRTQTSSPS